MLTLFSAGQAALLGSVDAVPQRRMRLLHRLQDHRQLVELVELAVEGQLVRRQALQQHLERLVIHRLGLGEVERHRPRSRTSTRRGRRRAGSGRRSSDRACRPLRSGGADDRTAADRPAARSAGSSCAATARRRSAPARRRRRAASCGARRRDSRRSRRGRRLRRWSAGRRRAGRAARPRRRCGRRCRISFVSQPCAHPRHARA